MADTSNNSFADIISTFISRVGNTPEEKGLPSASDNLINKNIITGEGSTLKKRESRRGSVKPILTSTERTRTYNIGIELARAMFNFNNKNKKDEKSSTILSQAKAKAKAKLQTPNEKTTDIKKPSWLRILLLLVGGIAALVTGLMTDGPFKGALKIAAKTLLRMALNSIKLFFKLTVAPLKALIPKNLLGGIISNGIGKLVTSIKGMVSAPFKALGGVFKVGGLFAKVGKFLKPLLTAVKRIPLLGSIISLAFAISRFRKGDVVGGVIDLLSALSGLLYLTGVGAPVAFAIGLGLDVLNAFLDVKSGGATGKQQKSKLSILGDMAKSIGSWLWSNALYIPILGTFKRWGMAYDAFKSGDIMGGLYQFGVGILSILPVAGAIITGLEILMGFGDSKKEEGSDIKKKKGWLSRIGSWLWSNALYIPILGTFKRWGMAYDAFKSGDIMGGLYQFGVGILSILPVAGAIITGLEILMGFGDSKKEGSEGKDIKKKGGWFSGLKNWLKSKLKKLPWFIRKPLEWFGILDDTEGDATIVTTGDSAYDKLKGFASSMWNGITSGLASIGNALVDGASKLYSNVKQTLSDANAKYHTLSEKGAATRVVESLKNPFGTIVGAGVEISELRASQRAADASETAFLKKQQEMINRGLLNPDGTYRSREERVRLGLATPASINNISSTPASINNISSTPASINNISSTPASIDIPKTKQTDNKDIKEQNKLIVDQNNLLVQLVMTAKEQLNVIKKGEKSTAVAPVASNNTSINQNNAFSTTKSDGTSMYTNSPYSISPSVA